MVPMSAFQKCKLFSFVNFERVGASKISTTTDINDSEKKTTSGNVSAKPSSIKVGPVSVVANTTGGAETSESSSSSVFSDITALRGVFDPVTRAIITPAVIKSSFEPIYELFKGASFLDTMQQSWMAYMAGERYVIMFTDHDEDEKPDEVFMDYKFHFVTNRESAQRLHCVFSDDERSVYLYRFVPDEQGGFTADYLNCKKTLLGGEFFWSVVPQKFYCEQGGQTGAFWMETKDKKKHFWHKTGAGLHFGTLHQDPHGRLNLSDSADFTPLSIKHLRYESIFPRK
jgi:hypothetical protein